jgi:hypothetical protein
VLRFASELSVPPTSNQAERDLRPAKTQQKISGRLWSEEATRHGYTIRSYLSNAAKHGVCALTAVPDALDGNPMDAAYPRPAITPAPKRPPFCRCAVPGMISSMIGRMHHVVLDCPDPGALAGFYSALLGVPVTYGDSEWVVVAGSDTPSDLAFQRAPTTGHDLASSCRAAAVPPRHHGRGRRSSAPTAARWVRQSSTARTSMPIRPVIPSASSRGPSGRPPFLTMTETHHPKAKEARPERLRKSLSAG